MAALVERDPPFTRLLEGRRSLRTHGSRFCRIEAGKGTAMNSAVQGFFTKVTTDAALQAACSEAVTRGDAEAIVRLGAEAGFSFTLDDLKQAWEEQAAELTDEDLEKVAGGTGAFAQGGIGILKPGNIAMPDPPPWKL